MSIPQTARPRRTSTISMRSDRVIGPIWLLDIVHTWSLMPVRVLRCVERVLSETFYPQPHREGDVAQRHQRAERRETAITQNQRQRYHREVEHDRHQPEH